MNQNINLILNSHDFEWFKFEIHNIYFLLWTCTFHLIVFLLLNSANFFPFNLIQILVLFLSLCKWNITYIFEKNFVIYSRSFFRHSRTIISSVSTHCRTQNTQISSLWIHIHFDNIVVYQNYRQTETKFFLAQIHKFINMRWDLMKKGWVNTQREHGLALIMNSSLKLFNFSFSSLLQKGFVILEFV